MTKMQIAEQIIEPIKLHDHGHFWTGSYKEPILKGAPIKIPISMHHKQVY